MKICLLSTATPRHQAGGTEVHAETLARLAAARGHKVSWITAALPGAPEREEADGYTVFRLKGTSHQMSRSQAPAWWEASRKKILELSAGDGVDVVWAENFAGLSYAALPRAERRPVISIVQGLAVRGEILSNLAGVSAAGELLYFLSRYAVQTIFYYIPRFRAMVRDSDLLVGISRETAEALSKEFPESVSKTRIIFNSIDTAIFRPDAALRERTRAALGLRPETPVILMSGVIHKQKGMHLGLNAFADISSKVPGARLVVAGDGPQKAELQLYVSAAGLSGKVIFCGKIPNADMPAYYNAADIYMNPTLRHEGLAIVTVEAMACGLPSVVSRIGGTGSTIDDGISGFFVKPGDISGLSEKAGTLLSNKAVAGAMGRAAREKALKEFSENNIDRYIEISTELAGGGR